TLASTTLTAVDEDAFVAAIDGGEVSWTRRFGENGSQRVDSLAASGDGVVVTGTYDGVLVPSGAPAQGTDVFLARYDEAGALSDVESFGSPGADNAVGVTVDPAGNVIATGTIS